MYPKGLLKAMEKITAKDVKYIKLGPSGEWEAECIESGFIKFGYHETPPELCLNENWDEIHKIWKRIRNGNEAAATRDVNQIKAFYTAQKDTVFITFFNGFLYWCQPTGGASVLEDNSRIRQTISGWHNQSIGGNKFTRNTISGQLYKTQGYRGTICNVSIPEYVIRKINDELSPEVIEADRAEIEYLKSVRKLCNLLTWQDFELLVDLIFSASGWRRTGSVGNTQKTVDLELELPTTGERAFVQVKSTADLNTFNEYVAHFQASTAYDRMFFVWHSGSLTEKQMVEGVTLIGPNKLAEMVLSSGLTRWLRNKVS